MNTNQTIDVLNGLNLNEIVVGQRTFRTKKGPQIAFRKFANGRWAVVYKKQLQKEAKEDAAARAEAIRLADLEKSYNSGNEAGQQTRHQELMAAVLRLSPNILDKARSVRVTKAEQIAKIDSQMVGLEVRRQEAELAQQAAELLLQ